ncbi:MAG: lipid-A-disaccharide synthase [Candidatus Omnitrophica bacterium]|nr:lipid-A-disaccharide synthase [Candidatus Omnitrophota bacterium]
MKKIVIVAGDKSGDLYGGLLSKQLKNKFSDLQIYSFGGDKLAKHSQQIIDLLSYSVCGLVEVLSSLKKILKIFKKTKKTILDLKPDLLILIDFPDFNLKLAKELNKKFPVIYYVSPQVWAWRKGRVKTIKKYVNKMVVLFEFEKTFYKNENMDVLHFGHPLLEIIKEENAEPKKIISFLPGSRKNEIKRHLPIMIETKKIIEKELPDYQFRIIRPPNLERPIYEKFSPNIDIVAHSYKVIKESQFIISSSGTATVELAILGVPYLIIYKLNSLSWHILKRMVKIDFVGMVNILAGKKIVDELLQKQANPKKIAKLTLEYLKDNEKYSELKRKLKDIISILSPFNATEKFTDFIGDYLNLT